MKQMHTVAGESVVLRVLPADVPAARRAWAKFVQSDDIFGLDFETTASEDYLNPLDRRLKSRMVQFGTPSEGWALDTSDPVWRDRALRLLVDSSKRFVSHTNYDPLWVRRVFKVNLKERSIDTKVLADLRFPGRTANKDLKALSNRFIDHGLIDAQRALHARFADLFYAQTAKLPKSFVAGESICRRPKCEKSSLPHSLCGFCQEHYDERGEAANKKVVGWGFTNVPLDDALFGAYAGLDAVYVRRLLPFLAKEIRRLEMSPLSRREQKIRRYCTDMQWRGMRVDLDWTNDLTKDIEADYTDADARAVEFSEGNNPRSPKMKEWLLSKEMRIPPLPTAKTPKGAPKLDKDNIPLYIAYNEGNETVIPVLEAMRDLSKNKNILTNLRIILNNVDRKGFIHPLFNTQQAHTGRMSIGKPAMQTFKKDDKRLRGCFISREGFILVGADYEQQEIRIGAALSEDKQMNRIVAEGLNQHVLTCENIFPDWVSKEENPVLYKNGKILDFAQQYGAGPRKLAVQMNVSLAEAKKMWLAWRETYAGLVAWTDEMSQYSTVINPFGRVIPRDPFRAYANGNYMIQSSGRDVLGASMEELAEAGWARYFWLPVHDELVMEVPEERAEEAADALTEHMTFEFGPIVIPAEGEIVGTRWGGLAAAA